MKYKKLKTEVHALLIIAGGVLSLIYGSVIPLLVAGVLAFVLMWWKREQMVNGKSSSIGVANSITLGRLCFLIVVTFCYQYMYPALYGVAVLLVIIADALDGYFARKFHEESDFGAEFDMEVDALLAAVLATLIYIQFEIGPWLLVAGFLRYIFVVGIRMLGLHDVKKPQMPGVKFLAVLFFISLLLPFFLPIEYARWGLAFGVALIFFSFGREFLLIVKAKYTVS